MANQWALDYRLGHLSDHILKIVTDKFPFTLRAKFQSHSCQISTIPKFSKLPFISHKNRVNFLWSDDSLYDIWAPFFEATHEGNNFLLTIVDDPSRYR